MAGRKRKDKNRIDVDYIVSWALYHSKIPVKRIAVDRDQTTASIYWQIKQVDKALDEKVDKQKIKNVALLCYPIALESMIYNLQIKKDVSMTQFFLKHFLELSDKIEEVGVGNNPIFIIHTDGSQPKTEDKPQELSKRFRLE